MSFKCIIITTAASKESHSGEGHEAVRLKQWLSSIVLSFCVVYHLCNEVSSSQSGIPQTDTVTAAARRCVFTPLRRKSKASNLTSVLAASLTMNAARHAATGWNLSQRKNSSAYLFKNRSILCLLSLKMLRVFLWRQAGRQTDRWVCSDCRARQKVDTVTGTQYNAIHHKQPLKHHYRVESTLSHTVSTTTGHCELHNGSCLFQSCCIAKP